jgi:hypothetical protein
MEELNDTYNSLINLLDEYKKDWSAEEKHNKAVSEIENAGGLEYYVNTVSLQLRDIVPGFKVKSPAKYFKKYEQAKIFQLVSIIEANENNETDRYFNETVFQYTSEEIQEMKDKLKELVEEYPQYVI